MKQKLTKKDIEKIDIEITQMLLTVGNILQKYENITPKTQQGIVAFWEMFQMHNKILTIKKLFETEGKTYDNKTSN